MSAHDNLPKARENKNDEFYTQLTDVENELANYRKHLKGKAVYCNCDDPKRSAFWTYFHNNFSGLGLSRLISTHKNDITYAMIYEGGSDGDVDSGIRVPLKGNGDFRSEECVNILKESDVVVTNPPFSLFREYVSQLLEYQKKFLIIGNKNAIINKKIFPLIHSGKVWFGYNSVHEFVQLDGTIKKFGNIGWYTNMDIDKRNNKLILHKKYSPKDYLKYDNYDAIDIPRLSDIPKDYDGIMGVPITIIEKLCPEQFEIIWQATGNTKACCPPEILYDVLKYHPHPNDRGGGGVINGKMQYVRIFVRRKNP